MFGVDNREIDCWLAGLKWRYFEHFLKMMDVHVFIGKLSLVLFSNGCDLLLMLLSEERGTLLMASSSLPWRV